MNDLSQAHVLVTGAGGFIGSHLVEALVARAGRVTAMTHYDARPRWSNLEYAPTSVLDAVETVAGDVTDPHFVRTLVKGKTHVFHLAALISIPYSYAAPTAYFQTNVLGTVNVLEACLREEVERAVFTSTSECYGTALRTPIDEEHPLQAQSPYSASKIGADKAVESFVRSFDLPAVTVRPFNTYGPRQSARAVIPTIISQALSDAPSIQLGALSPKRDLTYVSDTAEGFIAAALAPGAVGETINLGVGETISIGELAAMVQELTGTGKPIECDEKRLRPEASEVMHLISDNRKARELTGWAPRVSLRDGLRKTIEFVKQHPDFFDIRRFSI
ncbi:MAG: NAD-dependent epimerase/dehydratase family protein [bacterium]|nr:NAD-dependent epimerase/dehydratase family protein [bacterium]